MATYDDVLTEIVPAAALAEPAGRFDYPEHGIIARWRFRYPGEPVMDSESGSASTRLTKIGTAFIVDSKLDETWDGVTTSNDPYTTAATTVSITADASELSGWAMLTDRVGLLANKKGTASFWLDIDWADAVNRDRQGLFGNIAGSDSYDFSVLWRLKEDNAAGGFFFTLEGPELRFHVSTGKTPALICKKDIRNLPAGFHHIMGAVEGRYIRLYVDGGLVDEIDTGNPDVVVFEDPAYPGQNHIYVGLLPENYGTSAYVHRGPIGRISDIVVWDRSLAPLERAALVNDKEYQRVLAESARFNAFTTYGAEAFVELVDAFSSTEALRFGQIQVASETIGSIGLVGFEHGAEASMQYYARVISTSGVGMAVENIAARFEQLLAFVNTTDSVAASRGFEESLLARVALVDVVLSNATLLAREVMRVSAFPNSAGSLLSHSLLERLDISSVIEATWLLMASDGILLDAGKLNLERILVLIEKLSASTTAYSRGALSSAVAVAIAVAEVSEAGKGGFADENVSLSAQVLARADFYNRQIEQILLEDTGDIKLSLSAIVPETISLAAEGNSSQILRSILQEGITFTVAFRDSGSAYTGWAMNTETFAVSEYDSYPFNSFTQIEGRYYGANEKGLYELSGDSDDGAPIEAFARLGLTDFGAETQKRLDSAYLGFRANGEMVLKIETEDGTERWYKVRGANERLHRERIHPVGKGMRSVWWQFELANVDGADFELEYVEFTPLVMARSV